MRLFQITSKIFLWFKAIFYFSPLFSVLSGLSRVILTWGLSCIHMLDNTWRLDIQDGLLTCQAVDTGYWQQFNWVCQLDHICMDFQCGLCFSQHGDWVLSSSFSIASFKKITLKLCELRSTSITPVSFHYSGKSLRPPQIQERGRWMSFQLLMLRSSKGII